MAMASHDKNIPEDLKPPINMGTGCKLIRSDGNFRVKKEMNECDLVTTNIKAGTLSGYDDQHLKPDTMGNPTTCDNLNGKLETENTFLIKSEPGMSITITSIKVEDDFSEFEVKYIKNEQDIGWEEGTSSSSNIGKHCIKGESGPSTSKELNSEVDFGEIKMEKDEESGSRSTKAEHEESGRKCPKTETDQFTCYLCSYTTNVMLDMESHREDVHGFKRNIHACDICEYITNRADHLKIHLRTHKNNLIVCKYCSRKFVEVNRLEHHLAKEHSTPMALPSHKIIRCSDCPYKTNVYSTFVQHTRVSQHSAMARIFNFCVACDKEIATDKGYEYHVVNYHSENKKLMELVTSQILECSSCGFKTISSKKLVSHMSAQTKNNLASYKCNVCNFETMGIECFTFHLSTHHPQKDYGCIRCGQTFKDKSSLNAHVIELHSDDNEMKKSLTRNLHYCKHCKYSTAKMKYLIGHMKIHGDMCYICIKCKDTFMTKRELREHVINSHNDNDEMMKSVSSKFYRCDHCEYVTTRSCTMSRHTKTHVKKYYKKLHNDSKDYICFRCGKEFKKKLSLDAHIVKVHSEDQEMMDNVTYKIHHCRYCKYITAIAKDLVAHVKTHKVELEKN